MYGWMQSHPSDGTLALQGRVLLFCILNPLRAHSWGQLHWLLAWRFPIPCLLTWQVAFARPC